MTSHLRQHASSSWPLQDAKARFSEVVRRARAEGPQSVTLRGEEAVVVISAEAYREMQAATVAQTRESPEELRARMTAILEQFDRLPRRSDAFEAVEWDDQGLPR